MEFMEEKQNETIERLCLLLKRSIEKTNKKFQEFEVLKDRVDKMAEYLKKQQKNK